MVAEISISRRRFLKLTGWTAAGVTAVIWAKDHLPVLPSLDDPEAGSGAGWLQITGEGSCRMFCPRGEMGQNASVGLAQIVAEELNIDVESIEIVYPSTNQIPQVLLTVGSQSLALFSEPTAYAAAGLREELRLRAAQQWGTETESMKDTEGGFLLPDGTRLDYADLAAGEPLVLDPEMLNDRPPSLYSFDPERSHRQIGRGAVSHQLEDIVRGNPIFASDVRLENMLFGRVARPPARNAALVSFNEAKARSVTGVIELVVDLSDNFVGVLAETPGAAGAAIAAVEAKWQVPEAFDQQTIHHLVDVDAVLDGTGKSLEHIPMEGDPDRESAWDIDLRFDVQVQSHAMQEPRTAVARFGTENGREQLEIWTGSQDAFAVHRHAARDMGMPDDQVVVHQLRMGGAFGGRASYDVERDAARLARVTNQPVKVQWSREDEFCAARNRPASGHRLKIRTDGQGRITDWWHAFVSGHILLARDRLPGWLLPIVRMGGDDGVARGCQPPYAATRTRVEYNDVDLPIDLGSWRSLGAAPSIFAIESAVDELALKLRKDPVEFRLANLSPGQERLAECLRRTRILAEKVSLPSGATGGRGFACGIYKENSYVAASADVVMDGNGSIRVLRMCCVHDVGLVVNPDQVRAQIEGNLVWGLGMALREQVEIGQSEITSLNFDRYHPPRIMDIPELEIEMINRRDVPPAGAGEAAMVVAPPAIANAVRIATGQRFTRLPIKV